MKRILLISSLILLNLAGEALARRLDTPPPEDQPPAPDVPLVTYKSGAGQRDCIDYKDYIHWTGGVAPTGFADAVAISGTVAYLADGPNLVTIDISNPIAPAVLGSVAVPEGDANGICVSGSYAYVADGGSLDIVDISNPAAPSVVGRKSGLTRVTDVEVVGNAAYLSCWSNGLYVLDVSNPANPTVSGSRALSANAGGIEVAGTYAYISCGTPGGLKIVNIGSPSLTIVGSVGTPGAGYSLAKAGNYCYVADGSEAGADGNLVIIDVSVPTAPVIRGSCATPFVPLAVAVWGTNALVADRSGGTGALAVVNVASPTAPVYVGSITLGEDPWGLATDGSYAYIAIDTSGLAIVDVSVPDGSSDIPFPPLVGAYNSPGTGRAVTASGNRAYLADGVPGLHVVDLTNPAAPTLLGTANTPGSAEAVVVSGSYAFVADAGGGLQVIDVSNPVTPAIVGALDTPGSAGRLAVRGGHAYVADGGSGLQIIDISNPPAPALIGTGHPTGYAYDVALLNDYAYVADGQLSVLDISNPASPTLIGSLDTPGFAYGVAIWGTYAYVADGAKGLAVLDLSNPGSPSLIASLDSPGTGGNIAVLGTKAYLGDGTTGVQILDVSDPSAPFAYGCFDSPGTAGVVAPHGELFLLADGSYGLQVLAGQCGIDPDTQILSGPAEESWVNVRDIRLSWIGSDDISPVDSLRYAYRFNADVWSAFAPDTSRTFTNLSDGSTTFYVKARDTDYQEDDSPATRSFTVDATEPNSSLTAGPAGGSWIPTAEVAFVWSGTDGMTPTGELLYSSRMDGEEWSAFAAVTQRGFTGLAAGQHTFSVKARDLAGNEETSPATSTFHVDLGAPETDIVSGPPEGETIGTSSTMIGWTGEDDLAPRNLLTFSWQLDQGVWSAFAADSTRNLTGLATGSHVFRVRAKDAAGNIDQSPDSLMFDVDVTVPSAVADLQGSLWTGASASLRWTAPGDDGSVGTATEYDVRYATFAITSGNWATATQATGEPTPGAAGSRETMQIMGLSASATYYFAMKTRDEFADHWSGLSNVIQVATPAIGTVVIPDESGNGQPITFTGTPTHQLACVNQGLTVDGSVNYGTVQPTSLQMLQVFTVEGYVNWDGTAASGGSSWNYIIDKLTQSTDAGRSWNLVIETSSRLLKSWIFYNSAGGYVNLVDTDPLPIGVCVHVAITVDDSWARLYVNGVMKDQESFAGKDVNYAINTKIGFACSQNGSADWSGILDEFRISSIARTSFPSTPTPLEADASTIALWRFNSELATPETEVVSGPAEGSHAKDADIRLSWTGWDNQTPVSGLTYARSMDGGAWSAFAPDTFHVYSSLAEGAHQFRVKARDTDLMEDPTPAQRNFTVDRTPPVITVLTFPTGPGAMGWSGPDVTIVMTVEDNLTPHEQILVSYRLDAEEWSPFAHVTEHSYTALSAGVHTFECRARDLAGNDSEPPAFICTFTVDVTAPDTQVSSGPPDGGLIATSSTLVGWTGTDNAAPRSLLTFASKLDQGGWTGFSADSSAQLSGLADGLRQFQVKAKDPAGNIDASPATLSFTVDATGPTVTFTSGPAEGAHVPGSQAALTWTASDIISPRPLLQFATRLDGGAQSGWSADTTTTLQDLGEGSHTFEAFSKDERGHIGSAVRHFAIDRTPPDTEILSAPAEGGWAANPMVTFTWRGSDNVSLPGELVFSHRIDGGTWSAYAATTQATYGPLTSGAHTFQVRSKDRAGYEDQSPASRTFQLGVVDLQVTGITAPSEAHFDREIAIRWVVANEGEGPVAGTWYDKVYLSTDSQVGSDQLLGTYLRKQDLGADATYEQAVNVTVPLQEVGDYWFVVVTDANGQVYEHEAEGNNARVSSGSVSLTIPEHPNLQVTSVTPPAEGWSGQSAEVTWRVANSGDGAATGPWQDKVYLSADDQPGGDRLVATFNYTGQILPAAEYEHIQPVSLPGDLAGDCWVVVVTDASDQVEEYAEDSDNVTISAASFLIHPIQYPDLIVEGVDGPAQGNAGDLIQVEWTIRNQGLQTTDAPLWYDRVQISPQPYPVAGLTYTLGTFSNLTFLSPGATYHNTVEVSLPSDIAGAYYILVQTDVTGLMNEGAGEANNLGSSSTPTEIVLMTPFLRVTAVQAQLNAWSGEPIPLNWWVQNVGEATFTTTHWDDGVYLSTDEVWDQNDTLLGTGFYHEALLGPGETHPMSGTVRLPQDAAGFLYVIVVPNVHQVDMVHGLPGCDSLSVTPAPPADLMVTSASLGVATLPAGSNLAVDWTVTNEGAGITSVPQWQDAVWLSVDPTFSPTADTRIGLYQITAYLLPEDFYQESRSAQLPANLWGTYYVIVEADASSQLPEGAWEGNNWTVAGSIEITITPNNLMVSSVTVRDTAWSGSSVTAAWNVVNAGTGSVPAVSWLDRLYLSDDAVLTPALDPIVGQQAHAGPLGPGAAYSDSFAISLPEGISGERHLFVVADATDAVYEYGGEGDNGAGTAFEVHLTPPPDLQVSDVHAETEAWSGQSVRIGWTATNLGAGPTVATDWTDALYLSVDGDFDTGSDPLVGSVPHSGRLLPGEEYTTSAEFTLPVGVSDSMYVFAVTDVDQDVYEHLAEGNNTRRLAFDVQLTPPPDLQVIAGGPTAPAWSGTSLPLQWTVRNAGLGGTVTTHWNDAVYLSADSTFDAQSDAIIAAADHSDALPSLGEYTATANYSIPVGQSGTYHLFFRADRNSEVYEHDQEGNNLLRVALEIGLSPYPDLQMTFLEGPSQAVSGATIAVQWGATNAGQTGVGSISWQDRVYLSIDQTLSTGTDPLLGTFTRTGPLGPAQGYLESRSVTLPPGTIGTRYLICRADATDLIYEHGEEPNNIRTTPIQIVEPPPTLPDLAIVDFQGPPKMRTFVRSSYQVSWTVQNVGQYAPPAPQSYWSDAVYLSQDAVLDAQDTFLGAWTRTGGLAPNETYVRNTSITCPQGTSGDWHLILAIDYQDRVLEATSTNNQADLPVLITLNPCDLAVDQVIAPASAVSGQYLKAVWGVTNAGVGATEGSGWYDSVYLSRDGILDETDRLLATIRHSGALGSGAGYDDSTSAQVPLGLSGAYYVIVQTDKNDEIYEHQAEMNNTTRSAQAVSVVIPPPADLEVGNVSAPVEAVAGEVVNINWMVRNVGSNPAPDRWADAVYLSADTIWTAADTYLGNVEHLGGLDPGKSYRATYEGTIQAVLPGILPGDYHAIVATDVRNNVNEIYETNNRAAAAQPMAVWITPLVPDSTLTIASAMGQSQYFQPQVGPEDDIRLQVSASGSYDELRVLVGYGSVPDRVQYAYSIPATPECDHILPGSDQGCYLMVYADYAPGPIQYTIRCETLPFGIADATPRQVGNTGLVTFTLTGGRLSTVQTVTLAHQTASASAWRVTPKSSALLEASFDLRGAESGLYNIVAVTAEGDTTRLDQAIEVLEGRGAEMVLTIDGSSTIRLGATSDYIITLRNQGDADGYDVVSAIKLTAGSRYRLIESGLSGEEYTSDGSDLLISTREVRVGSLAQYALRVQSDQDISMEIVAIQSEPSLVEYQPAKTDGGAGTGALRDRLAQDVVFSQLAMIKDAYCDELVLQGYSVDRDLFFRFLAGRYLAITTVRQSGFLLQQLEEALRGATADAYVPVPPLPAIDAGIQAANTELLAFIDLLLEGGTLGKATLVVRIVRATDPNEMIGPFGRDDGFVEAEDVLPFTVYFENVPTATSPAHQVQVLDSLATSFDWRKFRLRELAFGDVVIPIQGEQSYHHVNHILPSGMKLEIDAGIDIRDGVAHWYFDTIDPSTGQPPQDPLLGFLPPNDSTGVGQGHVSYTIVPETGLPTATEIPNEATIIFDVNEPIRTNMIRCTVRESWPDLAPIAVAIDAPSNPPLEGEPIVFTSTIRNLGRVPADSVAVAFYHGNPDTGGVAIGDTSWFSLAPASERQAPIQWTPDRISGPQSVWAVVDPMSRILEEDEQNNTWVVGIEIAQRSFQIDVDADINLISLPLEIRPGLTAATLAELLGASMILRLDSTQVFVPYIVSDPGSQDFPVGGAEGYVVVAPHAASTVLLGVTNANTIRVRRGLNLISLPVEPPDGMTARGLTNTLGANSLILYSSAERRFMPFIPSVHTGEGYRLKGGRAYLVQASRDTTVSLPGTAWRGHTSDDTEGRVATKYGAGAPVLAVSGFLRAQGRDGTVPYPAGGAVSIRNLRTGGSLETSVRAGSGHFAAAFVDLAGGAAPIAGDGLELRFRDAAGRPLGGPFIIEVGAEEIARRIVLAGDIALALPPAETLIERVTPNPFSGHVALRYQIAHPCRVKLQVYSVDGRLVRTIRNGPMNPGYYQATWGGDGGGGRVAAGIYFLRFEAGEYTKSQKLVLCR